MDYLLLKHGITSLIIRVKILDRATLDGDGLTGLAYDTANLIISTIADNEATATVYAQSAGNIETVATLGTYAAPTAGKCRFKEVDATNHPGLYEVHLANARLAVASAKCLNVTILGAANCMETDIRIQFRENTEKDVYDVAEAIQDQTDKFNFDASDNVKSVQQFPEGAVVADGSNGAASFKTNLAEATDDYWKDCWIKFTSGDLEHQVKKVSAYNGTTKFVTVSSPFTVAPTAADEFKIIDE